LIYAFQQGQYEFHATVAENWMVALEALHVVNHRIRLERLGYEFHVCSLYLTLIQAEKIVTQDLSSSIHSVKETKQEGGTFVDCDDF